MAVSSYRQWTCAKTATASRARATPTCAKQRPSCARGSGIARGAPVLSSKERSWTARYHKAIRCTKTKQLKRFRDSGKFYQTNFSIHHATRKQCPLWFDCLFSEGKFSIGCLVHFRRLKNTRSEMPRYTKTRSPTPHIYGFRDAALLVPVAKNKSWRPDILARHHYSPDDTSIKTNVNGTRIYYSRHSNISTTAHWTPCAST